MKGIGFSYKKYIAILAVQIVLVMTVLDVTLVNVAVPVLSDHFHISNSSAVWIINIYQLVITLLLLPVSSLGDLKSYRKIFLVGVSVFTIASALCAASQTFVMVLVSRALQGLGAACVMGVNIALVRLIYPREILGRGMALNAMCIAVATAAGPTLAGAILSLFTWHWLFIINIPLGILAFVIGWKFLPQNPQRPHKDKFDLISAIENVVVFGLIFFGLGILTHSDGFLFGSLLLIAAMTVGAFYIRRQKGRSQPLLPVDLFRNPMYTMSIITSVCSFMAQNIAMVALPFLYLKGYGFSTVTTGLLMTPWSIATMIVSPMAARYVESHNPGATAAAGMGVYMLGLALLLFTGNEPSEWNIVWRMAVCGVGFGMFQTPNNIVMVMATPIHRTGGAGGMQSTARLVGQTLGATIVSSIFVWVANDISAVKVCLYAALLFAFVAGTMSYVRTVGHKKELHL